ncbi:Metacaspase-1 [Orobanche minor]
MFMLVNCSNCRTPLQLPQGAKSIQCALCLAVTHVADPRHAPPSASGPPATPSPYSQAPPALPPNTQGRKKAVIVGISYRYSRHELKGCINDAKCMKHLLITKFHFPESSILMLTEEETDPYRTPTKQNMRMAMYWLVQGCQPGDSLVFHYSGHGSRQRNYNGDEVDGYDETLCPLDFETQGMIVDDEINASLVRPIPHGAKLHAIIDACHSGTVLDLPFLCRMGSMIVSGNTNGISLPSYLREHFGSRNGEYTWEDHRPRSGVWKGSNGGEVISFSGCDDHQTSADTSALSKITSTGAMTFCFIQAIERGHGTTYGSMLTAMRTAIRDVGSSGPELGGGMVTSLLTMLLAGGSGGAGRLRQEPQLTACEPFDAFTKPFSL